MEFVESGKLSSDKDSSKFFDLKANDGKTPFLLVSPSILTLNGQRLVNDFRATKGEFLGGGVMKSNDFEEVAKRNPKALEIYLGVQMRFSLMSKSEKLKMTTQLTSEWIAFEYSLVISQTIYGHITSIKWDQIDRIETKRKGLFGQSTAQIIFRDKNGQVCVREIQANTKNIDSLRDIAAACKVDVK